ncbi:MAG: hypothetical protein ABIE74_07225 [Pseudomonadota bacterium]
MVEKVKKQRVSHPQLKIVPNEIRDLAKTSEGSKLSRKGELASRFKELLGRRQFPATAELTAEERKEILYDLVAIRKKGETPFIPETPKEAQMLRDGFERYHNLPENMKVDLTRKGITPQTFALFFSMLQKFKKG